MFLWMWWGERYRWREEGRRKERSSTQQPKRTELGRLKAKVCCRIPVRLAGGANLIQVTSN